MMHTKDYDFSFSGFKTAVLYKVKELKIVNSKLKIALCHEIQQSIIDVLTHKTIKAAKDFRVKSIILGGGVAANDELRKQLTEECLKWNFKHLIPSRTFCTDNAVMVAVTAYFHKNERVKDFQKIKVDGNLKIC